MFIEAKKIILIILGSLFLIIGFIGIFLPLLPTTPFLLLAAYCYLRGSARLYFWLMNNKVFGRYVYNYMIYKSVSRSTKISTMIILWAGLMVSMILIKNWWIRGLLITVGVGVSVHVLTMKTMQEKEEKYSSGS